MAGYDEEFDPSAVRERLVFDGKRMRQKAVYRKTVDPNGDLAVYLKDRLVHRNEGDRPAIQPHSGFTKWLLPPVAYPMQPVSSIASKFIHSSINKQRSAINCLSWSQGGRRCVTGSSSGEFTLWNGMSFNFETILQAHDVPVRSMQWTHNENWMVTGDQNGIIKYWQPNMNNVKAFQGHKEAVRDIKFSRTDQKMVTCSDDVTLKVWDFATCVEEASLSGHGWDVKCVDWHPTNSLIVSGSKDSLVKLWDAKSKQNVATLHGHKSTVVDVEFNRNGNWLLTASRDQLIKLFDIRTMKEVQMFRGHKREATCVSWHPFHEDFFASGGYDGSILFWTADESEPQYEMLQAHDNLAVWALAWHPVGHVLASCSNDNYTKFWSRQRPGDKMDVKYHIPEAYRNHYDPEKPESLARYPQQVNLIPPSLQPPKKEVIAESKVHAGLIGENTNDDILPGVGVEGIIKVAPFIMGLPVAIPPPYFEGRFEGRGDRSDRGGYGGGYNRGGGEEPPMKRARTENYDRPPPSFDHQPRAPAPAYSHPPPAPQSYSQPPPMPNYNQPPPQLPPGPPPNYNQPPPNYHQPPPGYGAPPPAQFGPAQGGPPQQPYRSGPPQQQRW